MLDAMPLRDRANECRRIAGMVLAPNDRAFWLRNAEDWLRVADIVSEKSRDYPSCSPTVGS
jgi:hypothetical protein